MSKADQDVLLTALKLADRDDRQLLGSLERHIAKKKSLKTKDGQVWTVAVMTSAVEAFQQYRERRAGERRRSSQGSDASDAKKASELMNDICPPQSPKSKPAASLFDELFMPTPDNKRGHHLEDLPRVAEAYKHPKRRPPRISISSKNSTPSPDQKQEEGGIGEKRRLSTVELDAGSPLPGSAPLDWSPVTTAAVEPVGLAKPPTTTSTVAPSEDMSVDDPLSCAWKPTLLKRPTLASDETASLKERLAAKRPKKAGEEPSTKDAKDEFCGLAALPGSHPMDQASPSIDCNARRKSAGAAPVDQVSPSIDRTVRRKSAGAAPVAEKAPVSDENPGWPFKTETAGSKEADPVATEQQGLSLAERLAKKSADSSASSVKSPPEKSAIPDVMAELNAVLAKGVTRNAPERIAAEKAAAAKKAAAEKAAAAAAEKAAAAAAEKANAEKVANKLAAEKAAVEKAAVAAAAKAAAEKAASAKRAAAAKAEKIAAEKAATEKAAAEKLAVAAAEKARAAKVAAAEKAVAEKARTAKKAAAEKSSAEELGWLKKNDDVQEQAAAERRALPLAERLKKAVTPSSEHCASVPSVNSAAASLKVVTEVAEKIAAETAASEKAAAAEKIIADKAAKKVAAEKAKKAAAEKAAADKAAAAERAAAEKIAAEKTAADKAVAAKAAADKAAAANKATALAAGKSAAQKAEVNRAAAKQKGQSKGKTDPKCSPPSSSSASKTARTCSKCKAAVGYNAKFCEQCGTPCAETPPKEKGKATFGGLKRPAPSELSSQGVGVSSASAPAAQSSVETGSVPSLGSLLESSMPGFASKTARRFLPPRRQARPTQPTQPPAPRPLPKEEAPVEVVPPPANLNEREADAWKEVQRILQVRKGAFRGPAAWGYAVLNVQIMNLASVQTAYRKLMQKLHPDKVGHLQNIEKAVEITREAKELCEKTLSRQVPPGPMRSLRYTTMCATKGNRSYKLQWSAPSEKEGAPVQRYLVNAFDPAYGKALTITILEPDYKEELKRYVSMEELTSFLLSEKELTKMPSLFQQRVATLQVAAANDAGTGPWASLKIPMGETAPVSRASVGGRPSVGGRR